MSQSYATNLVAHHCMCMHGYYWQNFVGPKMVIKCRVWTSCGECKFGTLWFQKHTTRPPCLSEDNSSCFCWEVVMQTLWVSVTHQGGRARGRLHDQNIYIHNLYFNTVVSSEFTSFYNRWLFTKSTTQMAVTNIMEQHMLLIFKYN